MKSSYTEGCIPPIPYIGGKTVFIPVIHKILPANRTKFVDVFGGGGSVTLSGKLAAMQIYNDYNCHLTNFMWMLQNKVDLLVNRLLGLFNEDGSFAAEFRQRFFVNSRDFFLVNSVVFYHGNEFEEVFDKCRRIEEKATTVAEKLHAKLVTGMIWERYEQYHEDPQLWDAVLFFIMMKCSYSATGRSWACKTVNCESINRLLYDAARQLKTVIIENKDCIDLIKFHDAKDVVFYCDPPYYMAEDLYSSIPKFGDEKHIELHDTLAECKGKVIVSYNDCDFVRSLYSDFYMITLSRPHNMVLHNGGGQIYNELLIANYDLRERLAEGQQLSLFDEETKEGVIV